MPGESSRNGVGLSFSALSCYRPPAESFQTFLSDRPQYVNGAYSLRTCSRPVCVPGLVNRAALPLPLAPSPRALAVAPQRLRV